jgi:FixJ family two-component response regulator
VPPREHSLLASAKNAGHSIAVVDDDSSVLRALSRLLSTAGYAVRSFGSASDFLEHCDSSRIECLIVDVQMPGMTGFELTAKLEQQGVCLPVVFISAHDSVQARQQAAELRASAFLIKPFSPKFLLEQLALLTGSGQPA